MLNKRRCVILVRAITFLALTGVVLAIVSRILVPKYFYSNIRIWSATTTCTNFYKLKDQTVDVLFLGSSRTMSSFSPQELYNQYI